MKPPVDPRWEEQLQTIARSLPYPPTPELTSAIQARLAPAPGAVRPRRLQLAWALGLALILLLIGALTVPPVRAALLEWLQIGAVRIWLVEPPTPQPPMVTETQTPLPTATPLASLFDLAGATTLERAQTSAGFPVRLPTYPSKLGAPDGVFFQELGGPVVVLVWLDPARPTRARLSLHMLGPGTFAEKGNATQIALTTVAGHRAVWTEGPYMLAYRTGNAIDWGARRLVEGHVLIWTEGELTYRLESDLPLEEVVQIAESMVALPPPSLNLTGKTTLAQAQTQLGFPLRLPTDPAFATPPDHLFVQETNGRFAVLVWVEPQAPEQIRLVLYQIGPGVGLSKTPPPVLRRTQVKGRPAVWVAGIHFLENANHEWQTRRLIDQDVLVWSERVDGQEVTYRLESRLSAEKAIQVAESLQ